MSQSTKKMHCPDKKWTISKIPVDNFYHCAANSFCVNIHMNVVILMIGEKSGGAVESSK